MLAVVLTLGVMPVYGTFASAGTDEPTVKTTNETPTPSVEPTTPEPAAAPAPQGEPETAPTPSAEPTVSPEPENTTYENSISGVLWIDTNEDGIYDNGEQALVDYPVHLYVEGDTDNVVQTATTDADGKYIFEDIQPGRYVVGIKAEENGTEYLLPLVGVQNDNKFYFTSDWSKVISNSVDVGADKEVEDINAAMRTIPQIQPMAVGDTYGGYIITNVIGTGNATISATGVYEVTGTSGIITVNTGVSAVLVLNGTTRSATTSPLRLIGTANVTLLLVDGTTNTFTCTQSTGGTVGYFAGIYVSPSASLTIEAETAAETGVLNANGGYYGAGIGGSALAGTDLGTSTYSSNDSGSITIKNGTITATAGNGGAGIGSGYRSTSGGTITINGGTVTADGWYGAGIGGGYYASCGNITINGGTVMAGLNAALGGTGIGSGRNSTTNGTITITGGIITAKGGTTSIPGIGYYSKTVNRGTVIFTGGSIYPTDSAGTVSVYPPPTNGTYGNDPVGMFAFTQFAGQDFSIMTAGSAGVTYAYKGTGHATAAYPWLPYPGVITDAATAMSTTAAVITAPSTVNSAASSTATLNGTYYLNNTYPVTSAYFEWGTSTAYGTTIDMTSSVNTSEITTAARSLSSPALTGLTPGTTYHYRFVIVTNGITVAGNDMTFTTPALAPSVDATHDYPGGMTATLYGIYDLNGGTFVSGEFELSMDSGGTWSTPAGGTLTGSTSTPTLNLTGLTPGTTYHYRITVTNSAGTTTTVMKELTVSAKNLTISKTVTGVYANMEKASTFTVTLLESDGVTPLTGTFNYTGGVIAGSGATAPANGILTLGSGGEATVTLTTGQTITIAGVATSAKVRVVQSTDANYTTSFKDSLDAGSTTGADTGVRNMTAADRAFDFTNTRSVVPGGISTGSGGIVLLSLMALLALAAGLAITAAYRRRVGAR